ncbi:hypothetical protein MAR_001961 [Mya arenaria]|uniref:Uncharacterized protein n=1 Tax=Mya arenaria TaxID=6604 RepID=A0ABY7FHD7_MYAAR|nr:uncharacterized protein LOC128208956 [Mya arenaria]XP_052768666.1 uncharacterized protein LOC128208956 [Mya arenaria]WAR20123.1 hypothetical protein MAR_001961 [Mya arenaria]
MAVMDGEAGIIVGCVFGGIFVFTCIISSVKAIRDRRILKKRIAAKEKERKENGQPPVCATIEDYHPAANGQSTSGVARNGRVPGVACTANSNHLTVPGQHAQNGVDNRTFVHSSNDIKTSGDEERRNSCKSKFLSENERSPVNENVPKRTLSNDYTKRARDSAARDASHSSTRRYSYGIAVCEHSWLPGDPPDYASSEKIMNTYNYGSRKSEGQLYKSTVGFENKAFDTDTRK